MKDQRGQAKPPEHVLKAFRADGPLRRLTGGGGFAWRAGNGLVKPADTNEEVLAWEAETLVPIRDDRLRLSVPRPSL